MIYYVISQDRKELIQKLSCEKGSLSKFSRKFAVKQISTINELEVWLKDQTAEVACVLAARLAMRVAPLLSDALYDDLAERRKVIVLPYFILMAAANFAGTWPSRASEIRNAARTSAREIREVVSEMSKDMQYALLEYREIGEDSPFGVFGKLEEDARAFDIAENSVEVAVHAAQVVSDFIDATNRLASPSAVFESAVETVSWALHAIDSVHGPDIVIDDDDDHVEPHIVEFWNAVNRDIEVLAVNKEENGEVADVAIDLCKRALWLSEMPSWASRKWAMLKDMLPEEEGWLVWVGWYEARLVGRLGHETYEFCRATALEASQQRDPVHVNATIAELVEIQPDPMTIALDHSLQEVRAASNILDLTSHINRIQHALPSDPHLAIGSTKDMLEAIMRTILKHRGLENVTRLNFPKLTTLCLTELRLEGRSCPITEGEQYLRKIFSNAKKMIGAANEIRKLAGTGHGRVVGNEPVITAADASLIASTGLNLAVWLLRHAEYSDCGGQCGSDRPRSR